MNIGILEFYSLYCLKIVTKHERVELPMCTLKLIWYLNPRVSATAFCSLASNVQPLYQCVQPNSSQTWLSHLLFFPDTNVQRLCRVSCTVGEAIWNVKEGRITRHSKSCQTRVTRLELVSDKYLFLQKMNIIDRCIIGLANLNELHTALLHMLKWFSRGVIFLFVYLSLHLWWLLRFIKKLFRYCCFFMRWSTRGLHYVIVFV